MGLKVSGKEGELQQRVVSGMPAHNAKVNDATAAASAAPITYGV